MKEALLIVFISVLWLAGASADCEEGWLRSGDYCYWAAATTVSFEDGVGLCATHQASLVSLATPQDLKATMDVARASPGVTQLWTCLLFDPHVQAWTWLDGTPYTMSSVPWWRGMEPQLHAGTTESCAALDVGTRLMHRTVCTARATPVCRRSAYKRELCNEEDGWNAIGSSCYKLFNDRQTWIDADKTCRDHSATLLSLPFSDTQRSVIQQIVVCDTSDNDVWISTVDVPASLKPSTQCNWVSVMYNQILVHGSCLKERKFICQKPQGTCAEGWLSHEGRCYRSATAQLPWFSAGKSCQDLGAAMLIISDEEEERFIKAQMISGTFPKQVWIGLSDVGGDGSFKWRDGSPVSTSVSHWAQGYPMNSPGVDCASMQLERTDAYWTDGYCYKSLPYVCEMSLSDDVRNVTETASCEPGWRLQGTQCYQQGDNKNYTEAESFCEASGGHLATVHSPRDQSELATIISDVSVAWIGLKRYATSSQFTWVDDGTTVTTSNWVPGEPKGEGAGASGMDCVQAVGAAHSSLAGAWSNSDCGQRANFICQRAARISNVSSQASTMVTAPWSWRCGEGWVLSPTLSACFLLVTEVTVPWAAARAQCLRQGADLVSIASFREQTVVEELVRSAGLAQGTEAWSGLWTGATDNTREGGWEWTDSTPFRYFHWSDGQPDNRGWGGEEQDCAVLMPATTLWDDRDCDELHNYVCKKTASPESTTPPVSENPLQPSGQCEGWAMLSGLYSVTDSMLVASSSGDNDHGPRKSRIFPGNTGAWMSDAVDKAPWLGVQFEMLVTVRGVQTTGGGAGGGQGWVSQYKLRYRYDSTAPLYWYSDPPGTPAKLFIGNNDTDSLVTHQLSFDFAARQVYLYPTQWTGPAPTLRWEILGCLEEECVPEYALSGPLVVPNSSLTASSSSDTAHDATNVRLNPLAAGMKLGCWRPLVSPQESSQWIQADFERVEVLRGVSTRGNPTAAEWVRSYLLLFHPAGLSPDDQTWKPYEEPYGSVKVFIGNVDNNSTVTNYLKSSIPTRRVRLQPQTWQLHIALQFDVLVCAAGCQEQALLARVSDEQLTATSSLSHHGPQTSRLTGRPGDPNSGGWQAEFLSSDQYIQVSLNVPQEVRAVATQGRQRSNYWVKTFYLTWSLDAKNWTNYTDDGSVKMFSANYDSVTVRKHYVTPFLAQYVRLHPTQWVGAIALRWELYGCPGKNGFQSIGCFADHSNSRDLPYEPYTDMLDGMDPILCSRHCFGKGYSYAGLQARDECYCGNSFGRYGLSPDCNLQCFPQQQFNCGGMTANFVYSTGLTSGYSVCPTGWKRLTDQCYRYVSNASDWESARAGCAAQQAYLASVSDRTVNLLLYSLMGTATEQSLAWIGLNDLREDRYFEWSDHEDVVYTEWDLHQPAPVVTGESRHCVAINNQTGGWVAEDCSRRLPYLCRTNPRPSDFQPNATATAPEGCQQGMFAYSSFCYVVVEETRTQAAARDVCTAFGGQLLVVISRFEQAFLTSLLSDRSGLYWTDVSDLHNPGLFTYDQGQYDVIYTNWDSGMPDSHRHGHCVALAAGSGAGLWQNQPCEKALKAICKLPRDNYPEPVLPFTRHVSNCSVNWVDSNSSLCYQINNVGSNLQRSWADARADCVEQRGDLASFSNTPLMEDFWRRKLLGSSNHFWIGLHALPSGALAWSDHSSVALDGPWSAGQPDTANGTQTCVELHAPSGTMALRDCRLPRNWLCAIRSGVQPFQRLSDRLAPTAGPAGSCLPLDDTWKRFGEFCYKVSDQPATWRQARQSCQQDGADLASVTGIQENMVILSLAQKTPQQTVWIGLNELQSAGGFYEWSDGSRVSFVNWDGNGPDDADGQESCTEMLVRTGKWNDNHCALSQSYVCKRNMSPLPPTTHTTFPPDEGGCGDGGWVVFGTRCYLLKGQQRGKTWQEAAQDCRAMTTPFARVSLASVRGPRENAFLTTQLYNSGMLAWIGLHLVNQTYLWLDEAELTYTHWDLGEPNGGVADGCVYMYSQGANAGKWNDVDCSRRMGWICESSRFPYWNVPATSPSYCPSGFQRLATSCYLFSNATHLSWQDAQSFCASRSAQLVSINSEVEQDFVYLGITGGEPVYFDPRSKAVYPPAWLGLSGKRVNDAILWQWTDGWPVTFTNWGPGGYLNVTTNSHCVAMDSNGTWYNQDCTVSRPFVCEINSQSPPFTQDPTGGVCEGHDWTVFGGQCYAFYLNERVTFAHAAFACGQQGASLVSIHSPTANQFLQIQAKARSALPVWIGFRRSDEGAYSWRDGSRVDYSNWDTGYPRGTNAGGATLRCAQLTPWNGRWIDDECSAMYGYICVKNKVQQTTTTASGKSSRPVPVPRRALLKSVLRERKRPLPTSPSTANDPHSGTVSAAAALASRLGDESARRGGTSSAGSVRRGTLSNKQSSRSTVSGIADSDADVVHFGERTLRTEKKENHQHSSSPDRKGREAVMVPAVTAGVVAVVVIGTAVVLGVWLFLRHRRNRSVDSFTQRLYQEAD